MADKDKVPVSELTIPERETVIFEDIVTVIVGNTAAEAVPANAARRALLLSNVSDATIYFSMGDVSSLTTAVYSFSLAAGGNLGWFDEKTPTQAVHAVCVAGGKNLCYQEAV